MPTQQRSRLLLKPQHIIPSSSPDVLTALAAYYELNEASGVAIDATGGTSLTDNNTVQAVAGVVDGARYYQRSNNEYHSLADDVAHSLGAGVQFTIAGFVQLKSILGGGGGATGIVHKTSEYSLHFWEDPSRFTIYCENAIDGGQHLQATTFGLPVINTWYFIACGWDGTNQWISINDGVKDTVAWANGVQDGTSDFTLGNGWSNSYDGYIDAMGLWKRTLPAATITWLRNAGAGRHYSEFV
jgi:hypothetical protein